MIFSADDRFNLWNTGLHHSNLWPANSADINPVDYWIWEKLQKRVYRSRIHDVVTQLKSRLMEELQHFNQMSSQAGIHVVELTLQHAENILNTNCNMFDFCTLTVSSLWRCQ